MVGVRGVTVGGRDKIPQVGGLEALAQALSPVGMVRFLQQFGGNKGDYSQERDKLLDGITMNDTLAQIQENRERKQSDA